MTTVKKPDPNMKGERLKNALVCLPAVAERGETGQLVEPSLSLFLSAGLGSCALRRVME